MQADHRSEQPQEMLVCMRENIAVSPEEPQCLHPSSACPFREHCLVRDAIRRKRRTEQSEASR